MKAAVFKCSVCGYEEMKLLYEGILEEPRVC